MEGFLTVIIAAFAVFILIKIISAPIKLIFKLLLNAALGFLLLYIFNIVGSVFGFSLNISLVNCLVCGILGIPGVIILVILNLLF